MHTMSNAPIIYQAKFYVTLAWVTRRCPGWFKIGIKKSIETQEPSPPLEDHLCAKFRPDPSSRLDFYREHTDTQTDRHTDIALYVLDLWRIVVSYIPFNSNF